MNVHLPAQRRGWPARLVILAVVVVVLALAAATFVLSYTGVHEIVLHAGVSARLARIYPGVFDAVLVIACVAAVMLRDARWWARGYAWLVIILVIGVVGAADAVHAMNVTLPHRQTEAVVAAAPWVLVLLGFSLMLTMLRQSRAQHANAAAADPATRASRRAAGQADEQPSLPPALEPPAELARHPVAPALPAAMMPDAGDEPPTLPVPTLVIPAFPESEAPATAQHHDFGDFGDHTVERDPAAEEASEEEDTAALRYGSAPVRADWAPSYTEGDGGSAANTALQAPVTASWHERVADSGDPDIQRHDYWDTDDEGGLDDRRILNRVRATPIPPEEDEE